MYLLLLYFPFTTTLPSNLFIFSVPSLHTFPYEGLFLSKGAGLSFRMSWAQLDLLADGQGVREQQCKNPIQSLTNLLPV